MFMFYQIGQLINIDCFSFHRISIAKNFDLHFEFCFEMLCLILILARVFIIIKRLIFLYIKFESFLKEISSQFKVFDKFLYAKRDVDVIVIIIRRNLVIAKFPVNFVL